MQTACLFGMLADLRMQAWEYKGELILLHENSEKGAITRAAYPMQKKAKGITSTQLSGAWCMHKAMQHIQSV
jgi:hypothetical protein